MQTDSIKHIRFRSRIKFERPVEHYCQRSLVNAHSALADAKAVMQILPHLKSRCDIIPWATHATSALEKRILNAETNKNIRCSARKALQTLRAHHSSQRLRFCSLCKRHYSRHFAFEHVFGCAQLRDKKYVL